MANNLLLINNRDSTSYSSFRVTLNKFATARKLSLKSFMFPNCTYSFNSYNNQFKVKKSGGSWVTVTIPKKIYNFSQLSSAIVTLLNAAAPTTTAFTCAYDTQTLLLTIGNDANFELDFNFDTSCYLQLGYAKTGTFASATSYTGTMPLDLAGIKYITINLDIQGIGMINSNIASTRGQFLVPVDVSLGAYLYCNDEKYKQSITLDNADIKTLNISIYDDNQNEIECLKEWSMILEVEESTAQSFV